ncbi:MAG: hypothetical protein JWN47_2641, partial [Frankiales bacterium]|nr:hypothetical protein [Frankiales bacterium]
MITASSSAASAAFGPTNVGIWGVALAVETLDGRAAVS